MSSGILVVAGDIHSNSKIGLCPPRVEDDEGGYYKYNKFQQFLWRQCWLPAWKEIKKLKKKTGYKVTFVLNGDTFDGDHHNTSQIITRNPAVMLKTAVDVIQPALDVADNIYVTRGTPAHEGESSWLAEHLANDISAQGPTEDIHSWWNLPLDFHGVTFNIQHHPESGGFVPWTRGAAANRIAMHIKDDYTSSGDKPPDVVVRNHLHKWEDSGENHFVNGRSIRVFMIPSWQGPTAFIHRIGQGAKMPDFGCIYFVVEDGNYKHRYVRFRPARQRPVRVTE